MAYRFNNARGGITCDKCNILFAENISYEECVKLRRDGMRLYDLDYCYEHMTIQRNLLSNMANKLNIDTDDFRVAGMTEEDILSELFFNKYFKGETIMKFGNLNYTTTGWAWSPEKLITTRQIVWRCPINIKGTWTSPDDMLRIVDDLWYIASDFIYNGASMVPSGKAIEDPEDLPVKSLSKHPIRKLWFATLIHDIGYRYRRLPNFPFKRRQLDSFLLLEMKKAKFVGRCLYWFGVRLFGGLTNWDR